MGNWRARHCTLLTRHSTPGTRGSPRMEGTCGTCLKRVSSISVARPHSTTCQLAGGPRGWLCVRMLRRPSSRQPRAGPTFPIPPPPHTRRYTRLILASPTLRAIPNVRVLDKTPAYIRKLTHVLEKTPGVPCVVSVKGEEGGVVGSPHPPPTHPPSPLQELTPTLRCVSLRSGSASASTSSTTDD